ncbi:MAG: hypothetical protein ABI282_00460, partial [Candidatus Baltobacteraceae bacterium]
LDSAIAVLEQAGVAKIGEHVLALTDRLDEGLRRMKADMRTPRGEGISSGIVTFHIPGYDNVALGKALQREGVITTWRPTGIRVAPHGYNTFEEIDRFLDLVPRCAKALTAS